MHGFYNLFTAAKINKITETRMTKRKKVQQPPSYPPKGRDDRPSPPDPSPFMGRGGTRDNIE